MIRRNSLVGLLVASSTLSATGDKLVGSLVEEEAVLPTGYAFSRNEDSSYEKWEDGHHVITKKD